MSSGANPFIALSTPPEGNDPEEQLNYLKEVVHAFETTGNARVRPLGRKLEDALARLAVAGQRGGDPEKLARQFAQEVSELRLQAYDLLLTVINQVRGTLRVKLQQGMPGPRRGDSERLQKALAAFSQALRKALVAVKKGDRDAQTEADKLVSEASTLLDESGRELAG
ncbi:MAG: hypothetical protein HYZ27_07125 [Deltaproteobacteria bacterium]|nr:hypothetical protein [Deltaproteobacteria bacterium]